MEKILVSCVYCREIKSAKGIFTHVDRTHLKLAKYSNGNNGSYHLIKRRADEKNLKLVSDYLLSPCYCKQCNSILPYNKRNQTFCGYSCSAIYTNARKDFTSIKTGPKKKSLPHLYSCVCVNCKQEFKTSNNNQKCCTNSCAAIHRNAEARSKRSALINYRAGCAFKFSLNDYPDEFDFSLVELYGWYKAKNRGNNLNGVSRDHMVSVRWGFDNNIPAYHLAHPANCRLVEHNKNVSKGSKNIITYEELLVRINEWDKKYPPSVHHNKVQ